MTRRRPVGRRAGTTKRLPVGANKPVVDRGGKDKLTRLVQTAARQAAREVHEELMKALASARCLLVNLPPQHTNPAADPSGDREERFFSVAEVAKRLGVSEKTVRRKISSGELPAQRVGRLFRIRERSLAEYLNGRRNK